MCGISGIFHYGVAKPVESTRLEKMTMSMYHRGPDEHGIWCEKGIGLGHRRLSVIDLANGHQPMHSADRRYCLVYNGEIYNFPDLRDELITKGHYFETSSDTEVLMRAWVEWGSGCVTRLNGMFAFAVFDSIEQRLYLVRDRLGVKPLYYAPLTDGSIIFASELKGLMAHPALTKEIDPKAIDDFMAFGYVPDHNCIYKGVMKLPAGHILVQQRGGDLASPRAYWDIDFSDRQKGSYIELGDELLDLMQVAVKDRMISDVPFGAFLSGGVDSSAVVALMAGQTNQPVKTCSIGFDVGEYDESDYAAAIAKKFKADHRSKIIDASDFSAIDQLAQIFDEPFADPSALATLRVCELAKESVTVALSGDGADEAFAGYRRMTFHHAEERARAIIPGALRTAIFGTLGNYYPKLDRAPRFLRAKSTLLALSLSSDEAYVNAVSVTPEHMRRTLYGDAFARSINGYRAEDHMLRLMRDAPARSALDRAQYADIKQWLPGDILTKVDRTSMAVSLEVREPLLDYRLMEFAARVPEKFRVRNMQGKWLLKKKMEDYLPHDVLYRPKMGFSVPISQWFRGPLKPALLELTRSSKLARLGIFNSSALSRLVEAHMGGQSDFGRQIWQVFVLEKALGHLLA